MNNLTKKALTFSAAGLIALATWEGFESKPYKDIGWALNAMAAWDVANQPQPEPPVEE